MQRAEVGGVKPFVLELRFAASSFLIACLFILQFNQFPLERFPNWDAFWVDTQSVAYLLILKKALQEGVLPALSFDWNFGWHAAGDTTLIVSAFNPIHWLVLIAAPETVLLVRTIIYYSLAVYGVCLFIRKIDGNWALGLTGGALYLALPMNYSLLYHSNMVSFAYTAPLLLCAIHWVVEQRNAYRWFGFALLAAFATAAGDIYGLIALPCLIGVYSTLMAFLHARRPVAVSLGYGVALVLIWLLVSGFYIVPFVYNVTLNGQMLSAFEIALPAAVTISGFWDFLLLYVFWKGFLLPVDTVSLIVYVPIICYLLLVSTIYLSFRHRDLRRYAAISIAIIIASVFLFIESFVFYGIGDLAKKSTGLLRMQISLYSYLMLLASLVCTSGLLRHVDRQGPAFRIRHMSIPRILVYLTCGALLIDLLLFLPIFKPAADDLYKMLRSSADFSGSSIINPLRGHDMWKVLPFGNLAAALTIGAAGFSYLAWRRLPSRGLYCLGLVFLAVMFALANGTIHAESRQQQGRWAYSTNSSYRIDSYRERVACLSQIAPDWGDLEYRTLYAGKQIFPGHSGRNWKAIAETELNVQKGGKTLYPYRNTVHPFDAITRTAFGDSTRSQNFWPPTTEAMAAHPELLRLLGVRWVVVMDQRIEEIATPANARHFRHLGSCESALPTISASQVRDDPLQEGVFHLYEVIDPLGVTFIAPKSATLGGPPSARTVQELSQEEWIAERLPKTGAAATAVITEQGSHHIRIRTEGAKPGDRLVVTMTLRPHWQATVDGQLAEISPAFGGFMQVNLLGTAHTVDFIYRPLEVWFGAGLTCVVLAILGLLGLVLRRRA